MIDFPTLFLKWYQKHVKVRFSYLLWHDNFCKSPPADTAKFPATVPEDSRVLRERRLVFPTSDRLETWLIPSGTNRSRQYHESTMV